MKKKLPFVSIITVNYNGKSLLDDCFSSLLAIDYPRDRFEIIMVDNGSTDESVSYTKERFAGIKVIQNGVNNYCAANNLGIKAARGQYIALINNDVKVDKNWLTPLVQAMEQDRSVGAAGSKILFMDGTMESAGHRETPGFYWTDIGFGDKDTAKYNSKSEVESICGCSVLYRKKSLDAAGAFDEDFNLYVEDVDMSIRFLQKGWKLVICPESVTYHKYHSTIKNEEAARYWQETNRLLLIAKHWPGKLADALYGKGYFTAKDSEEHPKDLSEVLGKVFVKLIKEHGLASSCVLVPDLFKSVRRIYGFEKDYLLTELRSKTEIISLKIKEISSKDAELSRNRQDLSTRDQQLSAKNQQLELLKQEKERELSAKNQQLELLKQEKERELSARDQQMERLKQEKERELSAKNQQLELLKQEKERELSARDQQMERLKQEKEQELLVLMQQKEEQARCLKEEKERELGAVLQQKQEELSGLEGRHVQEMAVKNQELAARNQECASLTGKVESLEGAVTILNRVIADKSKLLQGIYNSSGYRYILKPLWSITWPVKKGMIRIRNLILFSRSEYRSARRDTVKAIKEAVKVGLSIADSLPLLVSSLTLKNAYRNHLKHNTFPLLPRKLVLMITRNCNMRCTFCDVAQVEGRKRELDKADAFRIIADAARLGIEELVLTGGEPLLHPQFFEIVDFANSKDMQVVLTTNGILIKDNIKSIAASKFSVISVSIDGKEATHDDLRNRSGAYQQAIEAIQALRDNRINTSVNFVVTNKNMDELEEVYDYFSGLGIKVSFLPVINKPDLFPSGILAQETFLAFIKKLLRKRKISIYEYQYLRHSIESYRLGADLRCRCLGLNLELGIDTDGTVSPCCVWENRKQELNNLGNAVKDDLETLWYSSGFRQARLSVFKDGCSNCFNPSIIDLPKLTGINFLIPSEGKPGKNTQVKKPNHVHMRFTNRCNLSCKHCDIWKQKNELKDELSVDEWKLCIDKLSSWLGSFKLDLAGGEILLYPGTIPLIRYCADKGIITNLTTNATLIDDAMAEKIAHSGLYCINLSIDGLEDVHGYTRNKPDIFSKVRQAADRLLKYRIYDTPYISTTTVITRHNLDQLPEIIKLSPEWGINNSSFQALDQNFGASYKHSWFKDNEFWPSDPARLERSIDGLIAAKKAGIRIDNSFEQLSEMKKYYKNPHAHISDIPCQSGMNNFIVNERGGVLLCWNMPSVGDLTKDEPDKIWNSKAAAAMRRRITLCERTCRILNCNYA